MFRRSLASLAALLLFVSPALVRADEDTPKKGKKEKDKDGAIVAHIRLSGDLDETPTAADPLFGSGRRRTSRPSSTASPRPRTTPTSRPSSCNSTTCTIGWGKLDELRKAIADVRAGGKKVFAYLESADGKSLLTALACDEIGMPEGGEVMLNGMRAEVHVLQGPLREDRPPGRLPADGRFQGRGRAVHALEHDAAVPQAARNGPRRLLRKEPGRRRSSSPGPRRTGPPSRSRS